MLPKRPYNKFSKFATFVALTARDAFTTRSLQRRYLHMRYLTLSLLLFFTGLSYAGNYESLSFEEKQDYWGVVIKFLIAMAFG